MRKGLNKLYNENILRLLLIIFPFVELITSTVIIKFNVIVTPGKIYKLLLLVYAVAYVMFIDKKSRKLSYTVISFLAIVITINLIYTIKELTLASLFFKAMELSSFIAFPIYAIFLIAYVRNGNKLPISTLSTVVAIYSSLILVAVLTGTDYPSRVIGGYGTKGWFYSANEIGQLLTVIYPVVVYNAVKRPSLSKYFSLGVCSYTLLNIGTKAALLGIIGTLICFILYAVYVTIIKNKKYIKNILTICLVTLLLTLALLPFTPAYKYVKSKLDINKNARESSFEELIFTGRQYKLEKLLTSYNQSSLINKLFGIEDNLKVLNSKNERMVVERDFYDILFNYGIMGISIYIAIIFAILITFACYILKSFKGNFSLRNYTLIIAVGLGLVASIIAGHTLSSLTVSLYFAILLVELYAVSINVEANDKSGKVMFICSVGGHLTQMLQIKKIFNKYNYVLVTEKTEVTRNMKEKYNMRYLVHGTRKYMFKYVFIELYNIIKSVVYYIQYSPEVIVTTGTHTAVPMCFIAKFFGKKVVFIESFAKRTTPTKSGKLVYKIADTFVIQWDTLKGVYPKAEVWGWIY